MKDIQIIKITNTQELDGVTLNLTFKYKGELFPAAIKQSEQPNSYATAMGAIADLNANKITINEAADILFTEASPASLVEKTLSNSIALGSSLTLRDGTIIFNGEHVLDEVLTDHLLSILDDENTPKDETTWRALVRFIDNLYQNVNADIRKQLTRWMNFELNSHAGKPFAITEDGMLIGYRGCKGTVLNPVSVHAGSAYVNGKLVEGNIPNSVGSVVSMPRSEVEFNPNVGCSTGLHVGSYAYATSWAPILVKVKFNPRDVVSVPYEERNQKIRVCEFTVLEISEDSSYEEEVSKGLVYLDDYGNIPDVAHDAYKARIEREIHEEYEAEAAADIADMHKKADGKTLEVVYKKASTGETVTRVGTIAEFGKDRMKMILKDGGIRTLIYNNVIDIKYLKEESNAVRELKEYVSANEGQPIKFTYLKKDGNIVVRTGIVEEIDGPRDLVKIVLVDSALGREVRTLIIGNIVNYY